MLAERTFWEKATAIHVFVLGGPFRGRDAFARHWYDLVALDEAGIAARALAQRQLGGQVARHKSLFFREKVGGNFIDYSAAVSGQLRLVPRDPERLEELRSDYERMGDAGLFEVEPPTFEQLCEALESLEERANQVDSRS